MKSEIRKQLAGDISAFLESGGAIEKISSNPARKRKKRFVPMKNLIQEEYSRYLREIALDPGLTINEIPPQ